MGWIQFVTLKSEYSRESEKNQGEKGRKKQFVWVCRLRSNSIEMESERTLVNSNNLQKGKENFFFLALFHSDLKLLLGERACINFFLSLFSECNQSNLRKTRQLT